jgi:hypothetical protein
MTDEGGGADCGAAPPWPASDGVDAADGGGTASRAALPHPVIAKTTTPVPKILRKVAIGLPPHPQERARRGRPYTPFRESVTSAHFRCDASPGATG